MLLNASAIFLAFLAFSVSSSPFEDDDDLPLDDVLEDNDIDDGRSANEKPASRWPGGVIPYVLHSKFDDEERAIIRKGIRMITSKTCLKFRHALKSDKNYIEVMRGVPKSHCSTQFVGRSKKRIAKLNLEANSHCMRPKVVAHEFLHVAGLYHEMTRPDRDEYIQILWENMKDDKRTRHQYEIQKKSLTYGVPYDYGSIMHYKENSGSINGKPVMVKKKKSNVTIGPGETLTKNDIAIIKAMYCRKKGT